MRGQRPGQTCGRARRLFHSLLNDLGWCLFEAGQLVEAEQVLARAVGMDPADELAANRP